MMGSITKSMCPLRIALVTTCILIVIAQVVVCRKIYSDRELDDMSRAELTALIKSLQQPTLPDEQHGESSDGSCKKAGTCADDQAVPSKYVTASSEVESSESPFAVNDHFDDYDSVYHGLWTTNVSGPNAVPLGLLSLPNAEKRKMATEDERVRIRVVRSESSLTMEETEERKLGYERNQFNQFVSDRLSLKRRGPDTRPPACLSERYPAVETMPSVSVIIVFFNEARSTLLRTAWSVVERTPPGLLHEVILVDDGSDFEHLGAALDDEVVGIPKTRVHRLGTRGGLITAKVRGVENATGDVLAFMDSHCEVNDGWLEPLLAEIMRNPRAVALPIVDATDFDTFEIKEAIAEIGVFSWDLQFYWLSPPKTKTDREAKIADNFPSPIMAGGIFAMGREFFLQSGTYDENMDTWGGENFEMSFRVWMCGGELITVPCSRIAHVFRKKSPYKFKDRDPHKTIAHNLNRVAAVWMDDHASIYFDQSRNDVKVPDYHVALSERTQLREDLRCKSFAWYMAHVASIHSMFVPRPAHYVTAGLLRNEHTQECIYHEGNPVGDKILAVMRSCSGPGGSQNEGPEAMNWYYTKEPVYGELRHEASYGSRCLTPLEVKNNARISLVRCYDNETPDAILKWIYNPDTKQIAWSNQPSGCLAASKTVPDQVVITKCKTGPRHQWTFVPYP